LKEGRSSYDVILRHYDRCLAEYGDTARGADWPNEADRIRRFDVMLDVIRNSNAGELVLCDLGCGTGELLAHIQRHNLRYISYIGVDRSRLALSYARSKFPKQMFLEIDIHDPAVDLSVLSCDYRVANGLFTEKVTLTDEQMWEFVRAGISRVWPYVRKGLAFNVMSKIVDYQRENLFHLGMDDAARFLHELAGRRVQFRADYGLYEYTAYIWKTG